MDKATLELESLADALNEILFAHFKIGTRISISADMTGQRISVSVDDPQISTRSLKYLERSNMGGGWIDRHEIVNRNAQPITKDRPQESVLFKGLTTFKKKRGA